MTQSPTMPNTAANSVQIGAGSASSSRTGHESASAILARLRKRFDEGRTRPLEWRLAQIDGITRFVKERGKEIEAALSSDLGKPALEVYLSETGFLLGELALTRKKLPKWMKPVRVPTPPVMQPGKSRIYRDPLGVVLIIGPWNYPLQLVIAPLIGAVAAGNCAVIKPSEVAPATSTLIAELIPKYVDNECVEIVQGDAAITTELLAERFDHIFYTGGGVIGRIVMEAAAKHLTPVTLELGGKSPCIVDRNTDLNVAAHRILWGKFFNAGQTCVAPDYILAHEAIEEELLSRMKSTLHEYYGDDPRTNRDYARVVNVRHHQRLMKLLDGTAEVFVGGESNEEERYIAPTILRNVTAQSTVMVDEIFGPILPVIKIKDIGEAISFVNARPKPLALYLFSHDEEVKARVLERTSSGGATINHVWMHLGVPGLPFGGVGPSGMGAYHGRATFETFTHRKSVLLKPTWMDLPIMYPPYTGTKQTWVRRLV